MPEEQTATKLSIVVPVHNEAANLAPLLTRLGQVLKPLAISWEFIAVDDGSRDQTLQTLRDLQNDYPQIIIIELSRNFGKESALSAGLEYARGQAVIPLDADGQDPPEVIPQLIERWREGFEVVYAVRQSRRGESWLRRSAAWVFYRSMGLISEVPVPADTGDFRLLDRCAVDVLLRMPEKTRFMKGLFAWVGFKQVGVPYQREPRHSGSSQWSKRGLWKLALDGFISFSTVPLRIWNWIGLLIACASMTYGVYLTIRTLVFGRDVPGYASLMVATLFLNGLLMISVGMLGEYISRIYAEVKGRPLYVIRNVHRADPNPDDA